MCEIFSADIQSGITFFIAMIGCLIGIFSLVLSVYNFRRSILKDKISVAVSTKYYKTSSGEDGIFIEAVNTGFRPVVITHIAFKLSDGRVFAQTKAHEHDVVTFPQKLEPQETCKIHFYLPDDMEEFSRHIGEAYARTSTGEEFSSKPDFNKAKTTLYQYT